MSTKLDDYIAEVRAGYNDEQRAHLDAVMRHYDRVGQQGVWVNRSGQPGPLIDPTSSRSPR